MNFRIESDVIKPNIVQPPRVTLKTHKRGVEIKQTSANLRKVVSPGPYRFSGTFLDVFPAKSVSESHRNFGVFSVTRWWGNYTVTVRS